MWKYWTTTFLVALALRGCFVEAQGHLPSGQHQSNLPVTQHTQASGIPPGHSTHKPHPNKPGDTKTPPGHTPRKPHPQFQGLPWAPPGHIELHTGGIPQHPILPANPGGGNQGKTQRPGHQPGPPKHTKPSTPPHKPPGHQYPTKSQGQPRSQRPQVQKIHQTQNPSSGGQYTSGVPKNPTSNTCDVAGSARIACGTPDVSTATCLELGCCYDGSGCYYGKTVTVQCTKEGFFIVVVARDSTSPSLDLESIEMYGDGPSCQCVGSNEEFALYYFGATECGTLVREQEPGVIVYENVLVSQFVIQYGELGKITRDTSFDLMFQCRYAATSIQAVVIQLLPGDPPQPVASLGPVSVFMQIGNGQCRTKGCDEDVVAYSSFYTVEDYPVQKVLREPVYVQVELLDRTDPLLVLMLDHCWTTTTPNPHSFPQWDILINGCPNPEDPYTSELIPVPPDVPLQGHYRRFLFKMFAFMNNISPEPTNQQLYLHCSTSLCIAGQGIFCEPTCYRKLKKRESPATEKRVERNIVVTAGPLSMSSSKQ